MIGCGRRIWDFKKESSFSEEKEAKRLSKFDAERSDPSASKSRKFFGSFFQKRTRLLDRFSHLGIRRKRAGFAFGEFQLSIHGDFEHAAAGFAERDLGLRVARGDKGAGRTGSRLIASHAAVFDFDLHVFTPV